MYCADVLWFLVWRQLLVRMDRTLAVLLVAFLDWLVGHDLEIYGDEVFLLPSRQHWSLEVADLFRLIDEKEPLSLDPAILNVPVYLPATKAVRIHRVRL